MYLAQYKSLNKNQFCDMNEMNEQKLFFVMIYDVLNTLFKWAVTNVIYTTINTSKRVSYNTTESCKVLPGMQDG